MSPPAPAPAVLVSNGSVCPHAPPSAASFLESTPGAYTTARGLLWWPRHLRRLADSARLLARSHPHLLGLPRPRALDLSEARVRSLVDPSARVAVREMRRRRRVPATEGEEEEEDLALTALVRGGPGDGLDVFVHAAAYAPPVFGEVGARVAVAGRGRAAAAAKYASWARMRKSMEKMRPPGVTELLLTNDGDHILEGTVTNFFVVCRKEGHQRNGLFSSGTLATMFELQTAPLTDGILPGIIRQIVIEICHDIGIPVREVSPSWSKHELWQEAFVTSSLRLIQYVESVQVPSSWEDIQSKTWSAVSWAVKQFEGAGHITTQIQKEILKRARTEE